MESLPAIPGIEDTFFQPLLPFLTNVDYIERKCTFYLPVNVWENVSATQEDLTSRGVIYWQLDRDYTEQFDHMSYFQAIKTHGWKLTLQFSKNKC